MSADATYSNAVTGAPTTTPGRTTTSTVLQSESSIQTPKYTYTKLKGAASDARVISIDLSTLHVGSCVARVGPSCSSLEVVTSFPELCTTHCVKEVILFHRLGLRPADGYRGTLRRHHIRAHVQVLFQPDEVGHLAHLTPPHRELHRELLAVEHDLLGGERAPRVPSEHADAHRRGRAAWQRGEPHAFAQLQHATHHL
eukprot:CAMPEP_0195566860 /NCGR_PEP_ID=MMETSP0814-20130614/1319_1 /TAXON_ID=97485 /ORGANISM="Prymnesium parvum, Strain Texoma1" /LENGTH=197 /DNA_ID=CAMNT_0040702023 /DNA_START=50 /DNA_END=642 /DNA_ORIENTATION=+